MSASETCLRGHRWDAVIGSRGLTNEMWKPRSGGRTNSRGWIKYKEGAKRRKCRSCENMRRRASKYGVSADELFSMLENANCEICGSAEGGGTWGVLSVDHDHATGRLRGILCNDCNSALGLAGDSPDRLRAMAEYLERLR